VGWNGQEQHYEMAKLMWPTKMVLRKFKIILLSENALKRKLLGQLPGNNDQN
jgi:hypothetical protein